MTTARWLLTRLILMWFSAVSGFTYGYTKSNNIKVVSALVLILCVVITLYLALNEMKRLAAKLEQRIKDHGNQGR